MAQVKPTGGCIKCAKCEAVRRWHYCGKTRLTEKQLYNDKGYCSSFVAKKPLQEPYQKGDAE